MKRRTLRTKVGERRAVRQDAPEFRPRNERLERGRALRERASRRSHEEWRPSRAKDRDPVEILERSNEGRVPELVPIRFGRMIRSPFTFLRGAAGLMAHDLAATPSTGVRVQACGDCHLLNFGLFATPERALVFDINDFDETLPAPWEWDIKRLAASFVVAARASHLSDGEARTAARACVRSYRERLREYSRMSPLEVWYERLDADELIALAHDSAARKRRERLAAAARRRVAENLFPKIATEVEGHPRLVDQPPLVFHAREPDAEERVREGLEAYRLSLPDERRVLFDRYRLEDFAVKVVGIGSVGTHCYVALFVSEENHPLILQVKEATHSVLEPYAAAGIYENQGQRVVVGQRLMQSASDIFLGWARGRGGRDFYIRQLRDMKLSIPTDEIPSGALERYAELCGWSLARAHAKAGDPATLTGYMGKNDRFDRAIARFAVAYADQTERDHAALSRAARSGRIEALEEEV